MTANTLNQRRVLTAVRQPKVLFIDPCASENERVGEALRQAGFKVAAMPRLDAAAPLFRAFQPDVILVAAQAPHFEAVQVVKHLRTTNGAAAIPVLYVVDAPDPQLRVYCLTKGGGVDALARPVDTEELVAKIQSLVALQRAMAQAGDTAVDVSGSVLRDRGTSLFHRTYLLSLISHERRRCERHGGSFTVLMGTVETEPGALVTLASRVLRSRAVSAVTERISGLLREADVVARVGPRSFALLLPEMPEEHLAGFYERLQAELTGLTVPSRAGAIPVTVSLGSCSFPDFIGEPSAFLARAQADQRRRRTNLLQFEEARVAS